MDWRHPFGQDFGTASAKNSAPVVTSEPTKVPEPLGSPALIQPEPIVEADDSPAGLKPNGQQPTPEEGNTVLAAAEEEWHLITGGSDDADLNEWYWQNITDRDWQYLTGPREHPQPCPWCGGRFRHNPLCDDLHRSWEPVLPFGKHRGRRVSEIPTDYLRWLLANSTGLDVDLRNGIDRVMEQSA